jgi:large subunit ribosomal protein L14
MVFMETKIGVADNSGVKVVKCISKSPYKGFSVGHTFMASIFDVKARRRAKKGQVWRCLLIRVRKVKGRLVGVYLSSYSNSAILLKKEDNVPYANRLRSSAFLELRKHGFSKVLSMTRSVV